jgi:hypothetical protein
MRLSLAVRAVAGGSYGSPQDSEDTLRFMTDGPPHGVT